MKKSIINPAKGKLRVLGYCSGSGNTLWKTFELQKEMEKTFEGCPFEIVGIFADNPNAKAVTTAKNLGIPWEAIDIRKYYEEHQKPLRDHSVRVQFDTDAIALLEKYQADVILLAGYVWATTDVILDRYLVVNVHPGDLSVTDKEGHRLLAGANGIKSAFDLKMNNLRATAHLATKELDAGPILVRSPKVPVDYSLHNNYEDRFRYYLKLVNEQNRLVGARAILELALGNFETDEFGQLYYKGELTPNGLSIENWEENKPRFQRRYEKLLIPDSVAVIGAANHPGIGNAIIRNLLDINYQGSIYAVNKKGENVMQVPGYASILDIPDSIDLAIISIPSEGVLSVVEECGKKGVLALVCITAGFREIGGEGITREKELLKLVDKYNMCVLGPNCMGIANTSAEIRLSATILDATPPNGHIAFLTQSGALGASLIDFAGELDLGFSVIASLGNMANTNPCDLLPMLQDDSNTKIICMYMETIPDPYRFECIMAKITKPVIIVKAGRTSAGAAAASSHTGSLAGNDRIVDAFLKKCGILRAENLEDAFLLASTLAKVPFLNGNRVGILSNAGGLGTLTTDALIQSGFTLPQLDENEQMALAAQLLPEASTKNPLDLVAPAPPSHYVTAARYMINSQKYDALIVDCVPPATIDTGEVANALMSVLKSAPIPIFTCFFGPSLGAAGRNVMKKNGIPTFSFPDQMVRIMKYMVKKPAEPIKNYDCQVSYENKKRAKQLIKSSPVNSYMNTDACFQLLSLYGIPTVQNFYLPATQTGTELDLPYPVVAKIDHPDILHKSDQGGVCLNIKTPYELQMLQKKWKEKFPGLRGLYIQQQVKGSLEMILGASKDPALGHCIMTGIGGIFVELLKDLSFAHVPLSPSDPKRMLDTLKCHKLLSGYRGQAAANLSQLETIIMQLNQLLIDFPIISEMDINPLIYDESSNCFIAVDARIKL